MTSVMLLLDPFPFNLWLINHGWRFLFQLALDLRSNLHGLASMVFGAQGEELCRPLLGMAANSVFRRVGDAFQAGRRTALPPAG